MKSLKVVPPCSIAALNIILIFSVSGYFAHLDPDWHHDGILFKPAVDVASGKSLFRETFTQYGALTTYLQGAAVAFPTRQASDIDDFNISTFLENNQIISFNLIVEFLDSDE